MSDSDIPIAYRKGYIEFYKLRFKVDERALIPRPETELLVDEVIQFVGSESKVVDKRDDLKKTWLVLDIGTGVGNIAISIAKNLSHLTSEVRYQIIATDISKEALELAWQNAKLHGVEDRVEFICSDLLSDIDRRLPATHPLIIVTNLPYIPHDRIDYLDPSVKDFEPHLSLDGGPDGFELYRKLFAQIKQFSLPPGGWKPKLIVGEIDYTQAELAFDEAYNAFPGAQIEVRKDLAHLQRILLIKPRQ